MNPFRFLIRPAGRPTPTFDPALANLDPDFDDALDEALVEVAVFLATCSDSERRAAQACLCSGMFAT